MNARIKHLMPKSTAVWLIDNSTLTFTQIADFCDMHELEVQNIADGESAIGIVAIDPIVAGKISMAELKACEKDPTSNLQLSMKYLQSLESLHNPKRKYVPIARRNDKPNGVSWLIKHCPNIKDSEIIRLIGTTKVTIAKIRNHTHWNSVNIRPQDPVLIGICTQVDLDNLLALLEKRIVTK